MEIVAFQAYPPNGVVGPIHPKALPVLLIDHDDMSTGLDASWEEARQLQRPLFDDELILIDDGD